MAFCQKGKELLLDLKVSWSAVYTTSVIILFVIMYIILNYREQSGYQDMMRKL